MGNFDYARLVQPVLDRHCVQCHRGVTPPKGVDLTGGQTDWFNVSYDVLTRGGGEDGSLPRPPSLPPEFGGDGGGGSGRGYVSWIDTRNGQEANILQIAPHAWGSPASPLAKLLRSGHPDENGNPRIQMDDASRRRVFAWIDLNVPYYGTYEMDNPEAEGGRRVYPPGLDDRLADVSRRRCASCHQNGLPSRGFVRISEPEMNDFLLAPLAKSAGGRESCGRAVFPDRNDPDYQSLRQLFAPVRLQLAARPRMDMPGARPAEVDRSCQ